MTSSKLQIERSVEGIELPQREPHCEGCDEHLREAYPITAAVNQRGRTWHVETLWCSDCAPSVPDESDADRLVEARVGKMSDASKHRFYPVLVGVTVSGRCVSA